MTTELPASPPNRLASLDAYRGTVMLLMMAEVLEFQEVAKAVPGPVWRFLADQQTHVAWRGCSLHDLIQPSFSFLVGAALPYSMAARQRRGEPFSRSLLHAAWRSFALIVLGIWLRSIGRKQTNFTFEDTLTQIGMGYLPLFLLGYASARARWAAFVAILLGYWAAFAAYPLPGPTFDWSAVGVPPDWPHHESGFSAHWDKNSNLAWAFDTWFLNLFPRESPFLANRGGYATLSFIPTLATMLLGAIAGDWLRSDRTPGRKLAMMVGAGGAGLLLGLVVQGLGLCPIVKRIWTPSWTMFSGGFCLAILAGFYAALDLGGPQGWSYPLRVIGRNSIAAYLIAHLIDGFIRSDVRTHFGPGVFTRWGPYEPLAGGVVVLAAYWLILLWMDRRRIYLKI
ncbi:acyltransferase family protein (plasmid) [Tundrisphaera sp. TA3]|uniref:acyltransferase family protein n=1 Tax=Tundrisphaera sp. TA3 TaxID=3435775 RepID=UPI003EBD365A